MQAHRQGSRRSAWASQQPAAAAAARVPAPRARSGVGAAVQYSRRWRWMRARALCSAPVSTPLAARWSPTPPPEPATPPGRDVARACAAISAGHDCTFSAPDVPAISSPMHAGHCGLARLTRPLRRRRRSASSCWACLSFVFPVSFHRPRWPGWGSACEHVPRITEQYSTPVRCRARCCSPPETGNRAVTRLLYAEHLPTHTRTRTHACARASPLRALRRASLGQGPPRLPPLPAADEDMSLFMSVQVRSCVVYRRTVRHTRCIDWPPVTPDH